MPDTSKVTPPADGAPITRDGDRLEARGLVAGDEQADSEVSDGPLPPRTTN